VATQEANMERASRRAAAVLAFVFTFSPMAAMQAPKSEEEYDKVMKQVGATFGAVRKGMEGQSADAAKDAERLAALFKDAQAFWTERKVTDASEWAGTAMTHAQALSKAIAAKDASAAAEAAKSLGGVCQTCHTKYRDKAADGGWRIKPAA
jgi:cytochrome c556